MYKLTFYVPQGNAHEVKEALFSAGAGRLGNYDHCSYETAGTGQFRPLQGSSPAIGSEGNLERVKELRIEMLVADEAVTRVCETLIDVHPYEEPAYDFMPALQLHDL